MSLYSKRKGARVFVPEAHEFQKNKLKLRLFSITNVFIYIAIILILLFGVILFL